MLSGWSAIAAASSRASTRPRTRSWQRSSPRILPSCVPNACIGLGGIDHGRAARVVSQPVQRVTGASRRDQQRDHRIHGRLRPRRNTRAGGLIWSGVESGDGAVGMDPESGEVSGHGSGGKRAVSRRLRRGSVWFVGDECTELLRVDPASGAVQGTIAIDTCIGDVVDAGGEVWAGTFRGILRIDPATNEEVGWIRMLTGERTVLARGRRRQRLVPRRGDRDCPSRPGDEAAGRANRAPGRAVPG